MRYKIFTIHDSVAETYLQPIHLENAGVALRTLQETLKDATHPFSKNPQDFSLYHIGEFNTETGRIKTITPVLIEQLSNLKEVSSNEGR